MQISGVSAGYSDSMTLGWHAEAGLVPGEGEARLGDVQISSGNERTAALYEVLRKYDVTDITPTEFTEMLQKLYDTGAISESEMQQLAAVRLDMDTAGVEPDESISLLEFYAEKIEKTQRGLADRNDDEVIPGRQELGPILRRLDWIEKLALIQSSPDSIGLDATV